MASTGFISVDTELQYGETGSYQLNMTIPNIQMLTSSRYTFTGPDANGYGTFTPTAACNLSLQASDGTTRYWSDTCTCWADIDLTLVSTNYSYKTDSLPSNHTEKTIGVALKYDNFTQYADTSKFTITYSFGSGTSNAFTNISRGNDGLLYGYMNITSTAASYGTYTGTIIVSVTSNVDYYITTTATGHTKTATATLSMTVRASTPSVLYDVTPPSNFINQTYNINASAVPITRTVTWTEGSSSYYSQGGTKSASAIGTYTITFTLTSPSSHRWTDRSSDNTKSFTWKVLDPYIGYSRPQINGEDYEAIIFENGEAKLVVFKVGDT